MGDYEVGYKKPPLHSRFKAGNRVNPRGRGKRKKLTEAEILKNVMNFPAQFRERGKSKRAPRIELVVKRYAAEALKGDAGAAAMLLELRKHFKKHGDINPIKVVIHIGPFDESSIRTTNPAQ
ncbi:MAG TPA: DUF5681 domain-containing protein [Pyrinomonadaceae bacterium]|nr:DUF5681 domain-containing protein [Pyrinomonadaceae bacterium]